MFLIDCVSTHCTMNPHPGKVRKKMDQAKAYFVEQGVQHYLAYTAIQNSGAIKFYEDQGMEPLHSHLMKKIGQP